MAMKSWDEDTNTIIYDENVFNSETQTWIELPSPQKSLKILKISLGYRKILIQVLLPLL